MIFYSAKLQHIWIWKISKWPSRLFSCEARAVRCLSKLCQYDGRYKSYVSLHHFLLRFTWRLPAQECNNLCSSLNKMSHRLRFHQPNHRFLTAGSPRGLPNQTTKPILNSLSLSLSLSLSPCSTLGRNPASGKPPASPNSRWHPQAVSVCVCGWVGVYSTCVHVHTCVDMRVYVCVCARERESERESCG